MESLSYDVLENLLSTLTDRELYELSKRPDLKGAIGTFFKSNGFWLKRLEYFLGHPVLLNEREWKNVYLKLIELSEPDHSLQDVFNKSCEIGNVDIVELLLDDGRVDPSANNNESLLKTLKRKQDKVAIMLLNDPRVDSSIDKTKILMSASAYGCIDTCKTIIKR